MAATITINDVRKNPIAAITPDAVISAFIAVINGADACLDATGVADDVVIGIKLNAVWHLIAVSQRGDAQSERSSTGASINYRDGTGLDATGYGMALKTMDATGCVTRLLNTGKTMLFEVC